MMYLRLSGARSPIESVSDLISSVVFAIGSGTGVSNL